MAMVGSQVKSVIVEGAKSGLFLRGKKDKLKLLVYRCKEVSRRWGRGILISPYTVQHSKTQFKFGKFFHVPKVVQNNFGFLAGIF